MSPIPLQRPLCSAGALRRFSPAAEVVAAGKFGVVVSVSHTLEPHMPPERARALRGAHESFFTSAFCFVLFSAKVEVESTTVKSRFWLDLGRTQEGVPNRRLLSGQVDASSLGALSPQTAVGICTFSSRFLSE